MERKRAASASPPNSDRPAHIFQQAGNSNHQFNATNITYNGFQTEQSISLPVAVDARFNSKYQDQSQCLEDTRVELLKEIQDWIEGDDESIIFWLTGWAGTGKSTIARTIAKIYDEDGKLGATFFFSRSGSGNRDSSKFVTTIAEQLARSIIDLKEPIRNAIIRDPQIPELSVDYQWRYLVTDPLRTLDCAPPQLCLLVIDALDECEDHDAFGILDLISQAKCQSVKLRVLLTSRTETDIRYSFSKLPIAQHKDLILQDITKTIVNSDIERFLRVRLSELAIRNCLDEWPEDESVRTLVEMASGLFIWADTAIKFIAENRRSESIKSNLRLLCEKTGDITGPEKQLDDIYTFVLQEYVSDIKDAEQRKQECDNARQVIGCLVLATVPITLTELVKLADLAEESVLDVLNGTASLLQYAKGENSVVRLHHPSFQDFITNRQRCTDVRFLVDRDNTHRHLYKQCLKQLQTFLRQDMCGIGHYGTLLTEVPQSKFQKLNASGIKYALDSWSSHLSLSCCNLQDHDDVSNFLTTHLLHYIEACALYSQLYNVDRTMDVLYDLKTALPANSELKAFIQDAKNFVSYHKQAISLSPLQVYVSALVLTPSSSRVKQQFETLIPAWITDLPVVSEQHRGHVTLEGHRSVVISMVLMPQFNALVSASEDGTIQFWDLVSSQPGLVIEDPALDPVQALAFSQEKGLLASAHENVIVLWEVYSINKCSQLDIIYTGWSGSRSRLAFSSDDCWLAVGSHRGQGLALYQPRPRGRSITVIDSLDCTSDEAVQAAYWHGLEDIPFALSKGSDSLERLAAATMCLIKVWKFDTRSGELTLMTVLEGHNQLVTDLKLSPSGSLLWSSSSDMTVKTWDVEASLLVSSDHHDSIVDSIALTASGSLVACGRRDGTIQIQVGWGADISKERDTFKVHPAHVTSVLFASDTVVVSASNGSTISVYDITVDHVTRPHAVDILAMDIDDESASTLLMLTPDGRNLIRFANQRRVIHYKINSGLIVPEDVLLHYRGDIRHGLTAPNCQLFAIKTRFELQFWSISPLCLVRSVPFVFGSLDDVWSFSPDSSLLACCNVKTYVEILSTSTGLRLLPAHDYVSRVAFHQDGSLFATMNNARELRVHDAKTGAILKSWLDTGFNGTLLHFTRDNRFISTEFKRYHVHEIHERLKTIQRSNGTSLAVRSRYSREKRNLSIRDQWIMAGDHRLLWLPIEYRSHKCAVGEAAIVLSLESSQQPSHVVIGFDPEFLEMDEREADSTAALSRRTVRSRFRI